MNEIEDAILKITTIKHYVKKYIGANAVKEYDVAIQALQEKLDEISKLVKNGRYKPEKDGIYWFVNDVGSTGHLYWKDTLVDRYRFNTGNCFRTQEEAEFKLEQILFTQKMRDYAYRDWTPGWEDFKQHKYFICYDHIHKTATIDWAPWSQPQGTIYFESGSDARQFYNNNKADVHKYIFGLEE